MVVYIRKQVAVSVKKFRRDAGKQHKRKRKKWFLYVENSHNIHRTEGYIVRIHSPFIELRDISSEFTLHS